jgi:predicted kinase
MGPNTFLAQTKRADAVATADLQEVAARAGDFEQPSKRRAGRDRRLFSDGISGMGLNTFLAQTKRAAAVTTADLQEVSAHAGDFQKPVKSRPEWGRRLLSDGISGMGPNTFLAQTKRAAAVTTADLQEVSAHAGDFQKPVKSRPEWGRRLRRLLLWQTCFDDC